MNIFARITAVSGKRSGIFEDSVTTNATPEELTETAEDWDRRLFSAFADEVRARGRD